AGPSRVVGPSPKINPVDIMKGGKHTNPVTAYTSGSLSPSRTATPRPRSATPWVDSPMSMNSPASPAPPPIPEMEPARGGGAKRHPKTGKKNRYEPYPKNHRFV